MGALRDVLHRIGAWARPLMPDARDLHVYGGGLLMAVGLSLWRAPAGLVVFGALLIYLGIRRV